MSWHIITEGDDQNSNHKEYLLDSDADINNPPPAGSYSLASLAHTPGYARMWEAASDGTWVEIGGGGA